VSFTPAVLAVLVEDRRRALVRDLAFARRNGLRRSAAAFVLAVGSGITALGAVIDEKPAATETAYSTGSRASSSS
jgi:hypothetical protein